MPFDYQAAGAQLRELLPSARWAWRRGMLAFGCRNECPELTSAGIVFEEVAQLAGHPWNALAVVTPTGEFIDLLEPMPDLRHDGTLAQLVAQLFGSSSVATDLRATALLRYLNEEGA